MTRPEQTVRTALHVRGDAKHEDNSAWRELIIWVGEFLNEDDEVHYADTEADGVVTTVRTAEELPGWTLTSVCDGETWDMLEPAELRVHTVLMAQTWDFELWYIGEYAPKVKPGTCPVCGDNRGSDSWECPGCGSV